jgi:cytochrome c oxidase assembly protein subunit 15
MTASSRRIAVLRRTAWICAGLVLSIVGLSASIRLSANGLGCAPWPQCYGQAAGASGTTIEVLRVLHRVSAVLLLPLLLVLVMGGFSRGTERWPQRWLAVAAVAIALALAVLGRWTTGARVPAITLGNLLGGLLLLAVCARMALADRADWPGSALLSRKTRRWLRWSAFALLLQVALGGLLSGTLAGPSCSSLLHCPLPQALHWKVLNPWQPPPLDLTTLTFNPQGALLHWLHRGMAIVGGVAALLAARALRRDGWPRISAVLFGLVLAEAALGLLLVSAGLPLLIAIGHNLLAALLLALLLALA